MGRRILVILNPTADKGGALKKYPHIDSYLTEALNEGSIASYLIQKTECVGHAVEIARTQASQWDVLAAAGGDGTANEVVNGLMQARSHAEKEQGEELSCLFSMLPIGRGNDFSFGAGIDLDLDASLERLVSADPAAIDIGSVTGGSFPEGRYFVNGIGVGFDTIVGLEAARMKHVHGAAGYIIAALKTLIAYPPAPNLRLTLLSETGEQKELPLTPAIVSIMNGRRMGGAFYMAPEGNMQDGVLNLCTTKQGPRRDLLRAMLRYAKGTQVFHPGTLMMKGVSFLLSAPEGGIVCHADGETVCIDGRELGIQVYPAAIQMLL